MRSERTLRSATYFGLHTVQWIVGLVAAFLTLTAKQAKDPRFEGYSIVQWSNNHKGWIFVAMIAAGAAKFSCDTMGPPWAWKAIKELLDTWQSQIFSGI